MSISKLIEYHNQEIIDTTEAGLGKLIESVMKCATDLLGGEASEATGTMILQLIKKMVSILEQFNKKGNQFGVSKYMSVASEILVLIHPKLKVDLDRLETLIKIVEEEATETIRSDQLYSRALIQKSQRIFSLLSGSPSQTALKVGSLLQQLESFCGDEREANEQKLLKLMFGAVAVVSPKHRVLAEGYVEHGLKLISSGAGTSRDMFMTWFREFMRIAKPANLSQSELEQLIKAFEIALKQIPYFQTQNQKM